MIYERKNKKNKKILLTMFSYSFPISHFSLFFEGNFTFLSSKTVVMLFYAQNQNLSFQIK